MLYYYRLLVFLPTPLTMIHTNLLKHIVKDYICKRLCSVSPSYPHLRKLVFHSPFYNLLRRSSS